MSRILTAFSGGLDGLVQAVSASGVNNVVDTFVEMTQYNERLKSENLRMGAKLDVSRRIHPRILTQGFGG